MGFLYAIMLSKKGKREKIERKLLPISLDKVAKTYKKYGKFDIDSFVKECHPDEQNWDGKQLLKVGQKVLVLKR